MPLVPRVLRQLLVMTLLCIPLQGCITPEAVDLRSEGFNERLRPDRAPLTTAQTDIAIDALRFGPYRVGGDQLVPSLVPQLRDPVQHLPQSDCWWLARTALDEGDAVRAHWETVVELLGVEDRFEDPEDGRLEVGMCRLNDPETRRPPLAIDRSDESHREVYIADNTDWRRVMTSSFSPGDNFPRIGSDLSVLTVKLSALRSPVVDPLNSCSARLGSFRELRESIQRPVDFYDGPSAEGRVTSCTRPDGEILLPAGNTQYAIQDGDAGPQRVLQPALLTARDADTMGRPLRFDAGSLRWGTDVSTRGTQVRWHENFSPNLRVSKVRLFTIDSGGRRRYLSDSPRLCIDDFNTGVSCRWSCDDTDPSPLTTVYDLASGNSCKDAQGVPVVPDVNPTYSISSFKAAAVSQPLQWRFLFNGPTATHVEFTLTTLFEPLALTAEPAGMNLGRVRVGERRTAVFAVTNHGSQPMRIVQARIDPAWAQPSSFAIALPHAPEALPIGIELTQTGPERFEIRTTPEFESFGLLAIQQGKAHWHIRPNAEPNTPLLYDGLAIWSRDGVLYRDRADHRIKYVPPAADVIAPVRATVWAERNLPFVLAPGARFDLQVTAAPTAVNRRRASIQVSAESVHDPALRQDIAVIAEVHGLNGPIADVVPGSRYWDARSAQPPPASVLVANSGDVVLTVSGFAVTASNGAPLAPGNNRFRIVEGPGGTFSLDPGEGELLRIAYLPACGSSGEVEHRAALRVSTVAGISVVQLTGRSPRCH